ncbi:hypothetical protein [Dubosiella muris]|uniref:Uncharacterized protein n=1 Tax=Dubosiella muris TaxID=3038133 RepID=A0AC61R7W0_9FIRM|nr:hypothetical protein [Dubosiella muris]TGY65653.1 hypothetical protein E5336_07430 [Dubosiella muris]
MNKKTWLAVGMGLLLCMTGCSNAETSEPKKEMAKTEEKVVEEKEKEKTPYDVLQDAIKKDQEWESWSTHTTNNYQRPDFEQTNGGNPVEGKNITYTNNLKTKDAFYQIMEEVYEKYNYSSYQIQKATDEESLEVMAHQGDGNGLVGDMFIRNKLSNEKYEVESAPYSLDGDYFGEPELFDASQSQDGDNTIIKFTLKDGKKFQDYLVTKLRYDPKQKLPDGSEIDCYLYSKYEMVYTIDKDGYLQSYQLDMTDKQTEDSESNYTIISTFYKENATEVNSKIIDEVVAQVPETGLHGQMDVPFEYGEIIKP